MQTSRQMHKYVFGLVGVWLLFMIAFSSAYFRVTQNEKFADVPVKSLTLEGQ
jgi:nicotinamide riboside transporter PnuC